MLVSHVHWFMSRMLHFQYIFYADGLGRAMNDDASEWASVYHIESISEATALGLAQCYSLCTSEK